MKKIICLLLIAGTINCIWAQTDLVKHEWHVTLKAVDETGQPVVGASAGVGFYYLPPPPAMKSIATSIDGLTDTNGVFQASHATEFCTLSFAIEKAGYYTTRSQYSAGSSEYDPIKWNPTLTLVLKKVGQPIPMYAKWVNLGMPVFSKPVGFDLMVGDWVAPYGKGAATDIIFSAQLDKRNKDDSDFKLTVSFPNAGDGIQEFNVADQVDQGSDLKSPHEAPPSGYQSEWVQTKIRRPGQALAGNWDANRKYFFRVRTVLDAQGNVKSALYGKIYGDFLHFQYFLNPEPNSRNVEFDTRHSLVNALRSFEKVSTP